MKNRIYFAIDLKSFYASVECIERGLDSLTTNLVVADNSRTNKTICLAISSSLRTYGISGRPRLFEVEQKVKEINAARLIKAQIREFKSSSHDHEILQANSNISLDYIVATPQMAKYIEYSTSIYHIYLKYFAPEDIHVYSIDEVFIDITNYLKAYKLTPKQLAGKILKDVHKSTGILATVGIGTNLYLAKVAMDILAKKQKINKDGIQVAELDELTYRKLLWNHQPITDFWRVGKGYATRLKKLGLHTMGDIAKCSLGKPNEYLNEGILYKTFGVNAELLIDHAWGWESCLMSDIKQYKSKGKSIGSGQVLHTSYNYQKAKIVVWEMADMLALDLFNKKLVTKQIVLNLGFDIENLKDANIRKNYHGEITVDPYGREVPKSVQGTINLDNFTSSTKLITEATLSLFDRITDKNLFLRKINISASNVIDEDCKATDKYKQGNLFEDNEEVEKDLEKERIIQETISKLKHLEGKNIILKAKSLQEGATTIERNQRIGGHKA